MQPVRVEGPCQSRLTALEWHPSEPHLLGLGSKHGQLAVWDVRGPLDPRTCFPASEHTGPGAYTGALVFDKLHTDYLVTASMDRHVMRHNWVTRTATSLARIPDEQLYSNWWVSADVSSLDGVVLAGDCKGSVFALSPQQPEPVWKLRLNASKTHHIELSRREPWLFCTASVDHKVRLWDLRALRSIQGRPESLAELPHSAAVNVASFAPSGSARLMTSDQKNGIHLFQGPLWQSLGRFRHPHRQFQHLTPIRAAWHPVVDVILIGRYPETHQNQLRSIDFFAADQLPLNPPQEDDPATEAVLPFFQLPPVGGAKGKLTSISKLCCSGDRLATAAGAAATIWQPGLPRHEIDRDDTDAPSPFKPPKKQPAKKKARSKKEASLVEYE